MSTVTLTTVAGWDLPLLRGAVYTLVAVADRLPAWRARMEVVGRSLTDAQCWYGPAAQSAGTALVEVSAVATAVTAVLTESLGHAQRLLAEAAAAQELAGEALAAAAAVPVTLDDVGRLVGILPADARPGSPGLDADQTAAALRAQELAVEALRAAALAGQAADAAADAFVGWGIGGPLAPADFDALAALAPCLSVPDLALLPAASPPEVAQWWAALSTAARERAIAQRPTLIGSLDGVPAWARDEANRRTLDLALADPVAPGYEVAVSVAVEIARRESDGEQVQLYQFEPEQELVAVALGDVDTAESVALLVPGVRNDPVGDLHEIAEDAEAVVDAAMAAAPGLGVAAIAWLGYRPPGLGGAPFRFAAARGGPALDRALHGLAAARADAPARVTVLGHSYGSMVTDWAAHEPGELAADAVVLLGSPGMTNDADGLEAEEVYQASSPFDPISWGFSHGNPTWTDAFGAMDVASSPVQTHGEYYDEYFPTLASLGEVVAGTRGSE